MKEQNFYFSGGFGSIFVTITDNSLIWEEDRGREGGVLFHRRIAPWEQRSADIEALKNFHDSAKELEYHYADKVKEMKEALYNAEWVKTLPERKDGHEVTAEYWVHSHRDRDGKDKFSQTLFHTKEEALADMKYFGNDRSKRGKETIYGSGKLYKVEVWINSDFSTSTLVVDTKESGDGKRWISLEYSPVLLSYLVGASRWQNYCKILYNAG